MNWQQCLRGDLEWTEGGKQEIRRNGEMNSKGQSLGQHRVGAKDRGKRWSPRERERKREEGNNRKSDRSGYKRETVSQFTNPDFRSRTSIHVFTLTVPISFPSISLVSDSEETVFPDAFHLGSFMIDRFVLWCLTLLRKYFYPFPPSIFFTF